MPDASNEIQIKRVEFCLQFLIAIMMTSAAGLVLLQLNVLFGVPVADFDASTF